MNLFHRIALLFDKKAMAEAYAHRFARTRFVLDQKKIELAFVCQSRKTGEMRTYYRFKDVNDMPPRRYSNWSLRMEELAMGVNRQYLENFYEEMNKVTSGGKGQIDLNRAGAYLNDMKARMLLAPGEDAIYEVAAAEYFTLDEDLTEFNFIVNDEKIAFWKDCYEALGFFLSRPIRELVGWQKTSAAAIEKHLLMNRLMIQSSLRLFPFLNTGGKASKTPNDISND